MTKNKRCEYCGDKIEQFQGAVHTGCAQVWADKYRDALRIIANSEETDLAEYAKLCEDVAKRALEE